MKTSRTCAAASALLVLGGLVSCGGGAPALSMNAYLEKSERVCAQLEEDGHALPNPKGPRDLPAYLAASTKLTLRAKAELDRLADRFSGRSYVHKIFLDPMAAQIKAVADVMPQVVKESAQGATTTLDALELPQADLPAMGVYGFHECRKVVGSR